MSTYLVAFVVGELEATAAGDGGPDPAARVVRAGQAPPDPLRARDRRLLARLLRALLRDAVSGRQARHAGDPRLRGGRHGEPGRDHLPRDRAPGGRDGGVAHRARARGGRGGPRDRPHVVRRSRHHALVERDLAERGLRHLHGAPGGRRLEARVEALDDVRGVPGRRDGRGRPAQHPAHRVRGAGAARLRGDVRPAHLREGRLGPAHARAVPERRGLPGRGAPLPRAASLRQRRDHRSLEGARRRLPPADPRGDGRVDLPAGLPARDRRARGRRGQAEPAPLHLPAAARAPTPSAGRSRCGCAPR